MYTRKKKRKFLDYGFFPSLILIVFAFVYTFASQDPNLTDQHEHTELFYMIFLQGFGHKHFSFLQFLVISLSLIYYKYHWNSRIKSVCPREKTIIGLTVVYIFFLLFNPNSSVLTPILGLPLLSDPDLYAYLIFMTVVFLPESDFEFIVFFRNLIKVILVFFVIRVFYLFILWTVGQGVYYFGVQSITMEEDTLLLAVFVEIIFLALYYITKKKLYFVLVLVFQIFQILSFRRSGLLLSILVTSTYFILFYSKDFKFKRTIVFVLFISFLAAIPFNLDLLPRSAFMYLNRYVGAFIHLPGSAAYADIILNDHIEQSNESFIEAASHLEFWGFGYGETSRRLNANFKGNTGIHNVYHNLWEWQGLFALIYYLLLIFMFLKEVYITFKNRKSVDYDYLLLKSCVIIFFIFYLINAYVLMMVNFTGIKMKIMWVLVFAFMYKVKPDNYKLLFKKTEL